MINPAGMLFGPNASLSISGSFHASTANYLKLGTDGRFDATNASANVLTAAPPSAFGFTSSAPAPLQIDRTAFGTGQAPLPAGTSLSFVGGNLFLSGAQLVTAAGNVNLVSVASPGEAQLTASEVVCRGALLAR